MRRSTRRPRPAVSRRPPERSFSPVSSEHSLGVATPSPSPTPEGPKRTPDRSTVRADGHPKRPMNAFILFSNEMRSVLADENPTFSNAAVSVLLGQRWREMDAHDKAGYVSAAKRIKEEFHLQHPDVKPRCVKRAAKRAKLEHHHQSAASPFYHHAAANFGAHGRSVTPPSLQALAMVGSRLNQTNRAAEEQPSFRRCDSASTYTQGSATATPSRRSYDDEEEDDAEDDDDDEEEASQWDEAAAASSDQPSLLEQLCTVAESEQAEAARMLSALGGC